MLHSHAYRVHDILPLVGPGTNPPRLVVLDGDTVGVTSARLQVFKRSVVCCSCGREGAFFRKEKHHESDKRWHLNLYAVDADGSQVLMTKDHIVRARDGGSNSLDNLRTMCGPCNFQRD